MRPVGLAVLFALLVAACSSAEETAVPVGAHTPGAGQSTPTGTPRPLSTELSPTAADASQPTATVVVASPTPRPEPLAVTACGGPLPGGVAPGVSIIRVLQSAGGRSYRLYLPTTYRPTTALPLVLNFHGLGSNAQQQEALSGLLELAERERFALLSPEGAGDTPAWNVLKLFPSDADDVAFVEAMLQDMAGLVCFDPERVYAAGFSNGGFMASLLACNLPHRFAAVAAVGGVIFPGNVCREEVPLLAFHGTADEVIPFDGGRMLDNATYRGVRANLAGWAEVGHCVADAYPERLADGVALEGYGPCQHGGVIWLVVLEDFGHAWPDEGNSGISAAERIWDFFSRYP